MKRLLAYCMLLVALVLLPWVVQGDYYINLGSQMLIAALFAVSLNLKVGHAGLLDLGHAAYLGLSAYVSAWLVITLGWGHLSAALCALAATTTVAGLFGAIALRASGLSFLMITLALGEIVWGLAFQWANVTGGANGLTGLTRPEFLQHIGLPYAAAFYYFVLVVFVLGWTVTTIWVRSPFGMTIRGTRDQPKRMEALGYNVWLIRWITFTMSGFFGGVAGLLYVYFQQYISPQSVSILESAEMFLMVIAGGPGTLFGPVLGAVLVVLLKNVASTYVHRWVMLMGFAFLFIVLFARGGIVPAASNLYERYGHRLRAFRLIRRSSAIGPRRADRRKG